MGCRLAESESLWVLQNLRFHPRPSESDCWTRSQVVHTHLEARGVLGATALNGIMVEQSLSLELALYPHLSSSTYWYWWRNLTSLRLVYKVIVPQGVRRIHWANAYQEPSNGNEWTVSLLPSLLVEGPLNKRLYPLSLKDQLLWKLLFSSGRGRLHRTSLCLIDLTSLKLSQAFTTIFS